MNEKDDMRFVQSRINPDGGFDVIEDNSRYNAINPIGTAPVNVGSRYRVNARLLGRLESLAKAQFNFKKITKKEIERYGESPDKLSLEVAQSIAQSVNASSGIENEHIHADELNLVVMAVTTNKDGVVTDDLSERRKAVESIIRTYFWALTLDRKTYIDFELVLEMHRRMFSSTKPDISGRIKTKNVSIKGAGYDVSTMRTEDAEKYLRILCDSTNERLARANQFSEESMLLVSAEFIIDFLAIHPFQDGNGRTARLLSTYLLSRSGYHFVRFYSLDSIILELREEYYEALFSSQRDWWGPQEDLTLWVDFYVNAVHSQYRRAFQRVLDKHNKEVMESDASL